MADLNKWHRAIHQVTGDMALRFNRATAADLERWAKTLRVGRYCAQGQNHADGPEPRCRLITIAIDNALRGLSLFDRTVALVASIVEQDPRAVDAVAALISTAAVMARHLSATQRAEIAWHLRARLHELDVTWQ
jgi:hypothetical protein